jgi:hypothetical protein
MTEHEDFDVLRARFAGWTGSPPDEAPHDEVEHREEHPYDPFRLGTADRTKRQLSGTDRTLCALHARWDPQEGLIAQCNSAYNSSQWCGAHTKERFRPDLALKP